jgi:DNA-binding MarR family transcriptional regulator
MTTSQHHLAKVTANHSPATRTRLSAQRQRDGSGFGAGRGALDHLLEVFEQGQLSATEMRVLLCLVERRDASIPELATELGTRPAEITRAGRRLAMRGLVRWHYSRRPGQAMLNITAAGATAIGALLTALGQTAAAPGN